MSPLLAPSVIVITQLFTFTKSKERPGLLRPKYIFAFYSKLLKLVPIVFVHHAFRVLNQTHISSTYTYIPLNQAHPPSRKNGSELRQYGPGSRRNGSEPRWCGFESRGCWCEMRQIGPHHLFSNHFGLSQRLYKDIFCQFIAVDFLLGAVNISRGFV